MYTVLGISRYTSTAGYDARSTCSTCTCYFWVLPAQRCDAERWGICLTQINSGPSEAQQSRKVALKNETAKRHNKEAKKEVQWNYTQASLRNQGFVEMIIVWWQDHPRVDHLQVV